MGLDNDLYKQTIDTDLHDLLFAWFGVIYPFLAAVEDAWWDWNSNWKQIKEELKETAEGIPTLVYDAERLKFHIWNAFLLG